MTRSQWDAATKWHNMQTISFLALYLFNLNYSDYFYSNLMDKKFTNFFEGLLHLAESLLLFVLKRKIEMT